VGGDRGEGRESERGLERERELERARDCWREKGREGKRERREETHGLLRCK
jgi:hypothetical protein